MTARVLDGQMSLFDESEEELGVLLAPHFPGPLPGCPRICGAFEVIDGKGYCRKNDAFSPECVENAGFEQREVERWRMYLPSLMEPLWEQRFASHPCLIAGDCFPYRTGSCTGENGWCRRALAEASKRNDQSWKARERKGETQ